MSFQVGDYVEIEILDGYYRGEYASRIVRVQDNKLILVAPRMAGSLIPFKEGNSLTIYVCKTDARYVFEVRVISLDDQEFGHLTVTLPKEIDRKQHRTDVRLTIRIPVEQLYFYRNGVPVASYTLNSLDISAGGMRFETSEDYPLHTKLKLALILPESNEEITTDADVVRTGKLSHSESGSFNNYWVSVKFLNMSENKKKKILKFIFKQQELRIKGLI